MRRTILFPTRVTGPWARALVIVLVGGIFASAASLVGPEASRATTGASNPGVGADSFAADQLASARLAKLPAFLGSLTSASYQIDVYVGRDGPLYSIADHRGTVLADRIRSDEMYARFPELDLPALHAEAGTQPDAASER